VLKSTKVLDLLIDREGLERDPEFTKGRWSPGAALKSLVTDLFGRERRAPDLRVAVLNELDERVAVRRAERSFVIDITVMTRDPEKSSRLANALVHAYMEESAAAQAESARPPARRSPPVSRSCAPASATPRTGSSSSGPRTTSSAPADASSASSS
jgi:polysaccharide biosynthesis transport protein